MGRKDKPVPQQSINVSSVGMRLRSARKSKGKSLTEMAKALAYSVGYLSGIENGKHEVPAELVHRYEKELGLELGELGEFVQTHQRIETIEKQQFWYVPHLRNLFFTGRDAILEDMHERLWSSGGIPHALAIVGLSGVGKTQLAVEYVYRYGGRYQAVFWLDARSDEVRTASCVELAKYLDLPEKDAQDQHMTVNVVQRRLREISGSLIILDDVEDAVSLRDFLLQLGENHIIVTTRMQAVGAVAQTIELREMDIDEGVLLLLRRAKFISAKASLSDVPEISKASLALASELSETMAGLPIALDQAGSYIEETGCGLAGYLRLLKVSREKRPGQDTQSFPYPAAVAETWLLSFEKVRETNFAASELLYLCAFLGSDKIYEEFLSEIGLSAGPTLQALTANPFKLHQAIGTLRKYSLVRTDAESGALFIHPLVQAAIRDSLDPATRKQWAELTVKVVNQVFPIIRIATNWSETWAKCQRYFPQASACVALIEYWEMKGEEVTQLLRKVGRYLEERTQLKDAEEMYQRALSLDWQYYGERHIAVATDCGSLAMLYEKQNNTRLAERFYERAVFSQDQVGKLESLDPMIVKGYIRLLRKAKQEDKAGELRQRINVPQQTEQQQKVIKRTPINDDDKKIDYQKKADWLYVPRRGSGDFNDDIHLTSTIGASFEYPFEGIGIEIVSDTLSAHGEIDISIDGEPMQRINMSLISNRLTQTIIFSKTDLEFGFHTLKVELVNGTFTLDALAVYSYEEDE